MKVLIPVEYSEPEAGRCSVVVEYLLIICETLDSTPSMAQRTMNGAWLAIH